MNAAFGSEVSLDAELFSRIKHVYDHAQVPSNHAALSVEEKMLIEKTYKSFVRNGALLSENQKEQIK